MGRKDEPREESEARFLDLFDAHYGRMVAFGMRRGLARPDADDLAAEVFLIAWRRLESVDGEPLPWLYGIAHWTLKNHRRSTGRRDRLENRLKAMPRPRGIDEADGVVGADAVVAALARLSETDRDILRLVAWEGLEHGAVSVVLGCTTTAARLRLHRARRALAKALAASEGSAQETGMRREVPEEIV